MIFKIKQSYIFGANRTLVQVLGYRKQASVSPFSIMSWHSVALNVHQFGTPTQHIGTVTHRCSSVAIAKLRRRKWQVAACCKSEISNQLTLRRMLTTGTKSRIAYDFYLILKAFRFGFFLGRIKYQVAACPRLEMMSFQ